MEFIKLHLHPLGWRVIFWNIVLLIVVQFVLTQSNLQLAAILDPLIPFDSREIIESTNKIRRGHDLGDLLPNFQLDAAASEKLDDMAKNGYFAHISPQGITPWFWIKKQNYNYSFAGENLAVGFYSARDTLQAWYDSPSHRNNLLGKNYNEIGVAVGRGTVDGINGIVIVQMFGSRKTTAAVAKTDIETRSPAPLSAPPVLTPIASEIGKVEAEMIQISRQAELNEAGSTAVQEISTDPEIITTDIKPKTVISPNGKKVSAAIRAIKTIFSVYTFVFAAITAAMLFFAAGKGKYMAPKAIAHANIFVLSLIIMLSDNAGITSLIL